MSNDERWMREAIALAKRGLFTTRPNPAVGCVIVKDQQKIAAGWHAKAGGPHAEIEALNAANEDVRGATAYVTLEPCSHTGKTGPCAKALIDVGVTRVVIGMCDPHQVVDGSGIAQLKAAGIAVDVGVCEAEVLALNPGFIYSKTHHKPYVRCKVAMSVDGRTAMASGESQWITGPGARLDVQQLRARSGAIITGIGSVLADDPALTVRMAEWPEALKPAVEIPAPIRVVMDQQGRLPLDSVLVQTVKQTPVWCVVSHATTHTQQLAAAGVKVLVCPEENNLAWVLDQLHQAEVHDVLIESGPTLSGQAVSQGLVQELWVYMAPKLMGSQAMPLLALPGIARMQDAIHLTLIDAKAIEQDWRFIYQLEN